MIVYHYLCAKWGIDDLKKRRLKALPFNEANDVFDGGAFSSSDPQERKALNSQSNDDLRILCFSENWRNSVMWGLYGERGCGLCFGFEIPQSSLVKVRYSYKRISDPNLWSGTNQADNYKHAVTRYATKFKGWSYEREWRMLAMSDNLEADKERRKFVNFDEAMELKTVFIGCNSKLKRVEVDEALGDLSTHVEIVPTRRAFNSFKIVRQKDSRFWK